MEIHLKDFRNFSKKKGGDSDFSNKNGEYGFYKWIMFEKKRHCGK